MAAPLHGTEPMHVAPAAATFALTSSTPRPGPAACHFFVAAVSRAVRNFCRPIWKVLDAPAATTHQAAKRKFAIPCGYKESRQAEGQFLKQYKESRRATRGTRFLTLHLLLYDHSRHAARDASLECYSAIAMPRPHHLARTHTRAHTPTARAVAPLRPSIVHRSPS